MFHCASGTKTIAAMVTEVLREGSSWLTEMNFSEIGSSLLSEFLMMWSSKDARFPSFTDP